MPLPAQKVLVTGSSGLIGSMLIRSLADRYGFSGLDLARKAIAPDVPTLTVDASKGVNAILPAFKGVDAVVHLAADVRQDAPWDSVLPNNLVLTHNVWEACRISGVSRIVFASSNHAVGMFENDDPYRRIVKGEYGGLDAAKVKKVDHTVPVRPDGDYGISKAYGEAVGRYYFEQHGIEAACLRIGTVNPHNSPARSVRHFATWCSHRDLAQLVDKCLSAPKLGFEIFYGVSDNKWRFWDIKHAAQSIGFKPVDNAESYR
ncbi:MAG: NAD(P)-dependent oxidoreductase [Dehalococcoidia bacterium]|nr:NAD(P)-dependent oxidoreductase [Dehalococcoidia bacterium]MSQ34625.1 NAD(P)-dependent oxidoreductase [Dehalococcoidia bacterium]